MKKTNFLSLMFIAVFCVFTACSDSNDNEEVQSKLKPEEHKEKLANEGEVVVEKLDALANLETYAVVDVFSDLMDGYETKSSSVVTFGLNEINSVKIGTKESVDVKEVYTISGDFKDEAGIYNWDAETQKFVITEESETELTYKFKVNGKDAEISVSSFKTRSASIDDQIGNIESELPLELKMHIKLGSVSLTSLELIGSWNADNTPNSLVETLVIEDFTFYNELKNTGETISVKTSFKLEDYTIFASEIELNGNFDYKTVIDTGFSDTENEYNEALEQEVIENGNVWFQLGDIKVQGIFDVNNFIAALDSEEEPTDLKLIDLLNEHIKLYVKYANENEIIAKGEFFLEEFEDYGELDTEISLKMVFSDGSAVADSFFNTGFSAMVTDVSDLIENINKNYDLDIDTVD